LQPGSEGRIVRNTRQEMPEINIVLETKKIMRSISGSFASHAMLPGLIFIFAWACLYM
jgi:hypothetical protein